MSTGQANTTTEAACARGKASTFETRDFYLACFLRCTGYKLINMRAEGRRRVFVFKDRPERRDDVIAFYAEGGSVPPLAFAAAIKDMRHCSTMHDIRKLPTPNRSYATPVCAALEFLENLLVEGLKHGHFEYSINCETGNNGRRLLIIRAGKSYKFTIPEADVPR